MPFFLSIVSLLLTLLPQWSYFCFQAELQFIWTYDFTRHYLNLRLLARYNSFIRLHLYCGSVARVCGLLADLAGRILQKDPTNMTTIVYLSRKFHKYSFIHWILRNHSRIEMAVQLQKGFGPLLQWMKISFYCHYKPWKNMAERTICFYDLRKKMSLPFFSASEIVFIIKDCVTYPPIKFAKQTQIPSSSLLMITPSSGCFARVWMWTAIKVKALDIRQA